MFKNFAAPQADNGNQDGPIDADDAWTVIKAYFQQHGLVSQ
jgi:hypothetical protein